MGVEDGVCVCVSECLICLLFYQIKVRSKGTWSEIWLSETPEEGSGSTEGEVGVLPHSADQVDLPSYP